MAFQPVNGCAEAVVRFQQNGVIVTNTFYGSFGGNYNQSNITALAGVMNSWVVNEFLPEISNQVTYLSVEARGLENENDYVASNATGTAVGGTTGTPLPNNVSFSVKRSSGLTGRSARGRIYLIGLYQSALSSDENFVTQGIINDIVTALNTVRTYMATASWEEVIVSRYANNAKRVSGVIFGVDQYEVVDYRVDSQRNRLPG